MVALDFAALDGGFLLPGEADPVWAGDVDRMFVSLVPPGYDGERCAAGGAGGGLGRADRRSPATGRDRCWRSAMRWCRAHGLRIATGYDDSYHLTPARVLRNALQLGYRGTINPLCRDEPLFPARARRRRADAAGRRRAERRVRGVASRLRGAGEGAGL